MHFREKNKNLRIAHCLISPEELKSYLLLTSAVKGEGRKSRCITGSENKSSCMRKSRAIEEIQKEDQMTEFHGLGVRKASNVVINGTG